MSLQSVFAEIETANKIAVVTDTFGHLFPRESKDGYVTLANTEYKGIVVIKEELDIKASPWWYTAIHDFADKMMKNADPGVIKRIPISVTIREYKNGDSKIIIRRKVRSKKK